MDIVNILNNLIDNIILKEDNNDNFLLALTMYINFYYESIVSEEKIMNYLVDSEDLINKLSYTYTEYTRRQLESMYIALTICLILSFICFDNLDNNLDLD